jgi:hypothetical protein
VGGAAASADQTESNVEGSKKEGTIFFGSIVAVLGWLPHQLGCVLL